MCMPNEQKIQDILQAGYWTGRRDSYLEESKLDMKHLAAATASDCSDIDVRASIIIVFSFIIC